MQAVAAAVCSHFQSGLSAQTDCVRPQMAATATLQQHTQIVGVLYQFVRSVVGGLGNLTIWRMGPGSWVWPWWMAKLSVQLRSCPINQSVERGRRAARGQ